MPGFVLNKKTGLCEPESPMSQASDEGAQAFKPKAGSKMERCILQVKESLRGKNPKANDQAIKSSAIAICRSRLKQ